MTRHENTACCHSKPLGYNACGRPGCICSKLPQPSTSRTSLAPGAISRTQPPCRSSSAPTA